MIENFWIESSSISTKNFKMSGKNMPPNASNLKYVNTIEQYPKYLKQYSNLWRVMEKK